MEHERIFKDGFKNMLAMHGKLCAIFHFINVLFSRFLKALKLPKLKRAFTIASLPLCDNLKHHFKASCFTIVQ